MSKPDMESRPLESSSDANPIPVYIAPYQDRGDEVSLIDLWRVIAKRKGIILLCFLASVMLAAVYIVFSEPLYKANAYLLPPQQKTIQALLIDYRGLEGIDVDRYTPESVYSAFLNNLQSQGARREFFENHDLITHYAAGESIEDVDVDHVFNKKFNERFKVQVGQKDVSFVPVSFIDNTPALAAQWLNEFIEYANKRTVNQLFSDVNSAIKSEIGKVRFQLDSKLKLAEQRRLDTIVTLKEALHVAEALGIEDAGTFAEMAKKTKSGLVVNTAQAPLYTRGTKALETEISVLEARKSDEPFITGFRDLQEKRAFLEGVFIDLDTLSAVTVDVAARTPSRAEKPRKGLVIALAAVFGMLIGLFAAFVAEFFSRLD